MRKILSLTVVMVAVACFLAKPAPAGDKEKKDEGKAVAAEAKAEAKDAKTEAPAAKEGEAPETILMDKTAKMAPVKFPHKAHAEKVDGCKTCHEGEKPLFAQKKSEEGMKMADMYAGKGCGSCHDGKKEKGKAFAAKGGCMKCHKK